MKLLLIGPYPVRNNGMSEYMAHYRAELQSRGHEVQTERMYFWLEKRTLFRWLGLRKRLRESFDAVIVQHTPTASGPLLPIFLSAARRAGVRAVVVGHEPPSVYAKHLPSYLRPLYHAYERAVFTRASARVVHTRIHAAELHAIGVPEPVAVIPIPVYGPEPVAGETRRQAWGYYGMISAKKGVDLLLDAYQSQPPGHFPPLRILGGPAPGHESYVQSLQAKVRPEYKGHIAFVGYVEEEKLADELGSISLMVFPYRWVSQSAALAQTCRHRIPYLAADLPYFADFQKSHGCGKLFTAGSSEALAAAMDEAVKNPMTEKDLPFDVLILELNLSRCADRLLECVAHATK